MKPGDLVTTKKGHSFHIPKVGLFLGMRTYKGRHGKGEYTCAEVMFFGHSAPSGDPVSSIQYDLIEVFNESR